MTVRNKIKLILNGRKSCNTIQQNGVDTGGHGDGIFLQTSDFNWDAALNKFVIKYNNLGNSVWDQFDIYIEPDADCSWSKELEVDATNNYWQTSNPSDTIYDSSDDACAGIVHFEPTASSVMIPSPLRSHPTLLSPENYSEVEQTPPDYSGGGPISSYNINFSWSSVPTATKYLLCTDHSAPFYVQFSLWPWMYCRTNQLKN